MALHDNISMHLRQAYLAMHRRAQAHFAQFGVTADQYVLLGLLEEEGPITQAALGEKARSDPNTITAMLRLLEAKKLILRKSHPEDGRARLVSLSSSGVRFQKKLVEGARELHQSMEVAMSLAERKAFCRQLNELTQAMSTNGAEGMPRRDAEARRTEKESRRNRSSIH